MLGISFTNDRCKVTCNLDSKNIEFLISKLKNLEQINLLDSSGLALTIDN